MFWATSSKEQPWVTSHQRHLIHTVCVCNSAMVGMISHYIKNNYRIPTDPTEPYRAKETFTDALEKNTKPLPKTQTLTREEHTWPLVQAHMWGKHAEAIFVGLGERKQITAHYHRLHAHKSVCTHKGAGIILARAPVYYLVLWGREEAEDEVEEGEGELVVFRRCLAIRRPCLCACEKGSSSQINTSSA